MSVNILADQYLKYLDELLPEKIELTRFDPAGGLPDNATNFDAILVRTVTPIAETTFPNAGNVKFIGTATAGTDHIDQNHLKELGVEFSQSEGCNANAVAEYIITVLYRWAEKSSIELTEKTIGVVGCGHTGGSVIQLLKKLGINHVAYDPPKALRETGFNSATTEELLEADILSFHTPFTNAGDHPTNHLGSKEWFQHRFDLIINASRGGVVDEDALFQSYQQKLVRNYILDVWENEPTFSNQLAKSAFIATPHIAGYSVESKFKATKIVLTRLLQHFGLNINPDAQPDPFNPSDFTFSNDFSFSELLWQNNQTHFYDSELRKLVGFPHEIKNKQFALLRSKTTLRHEYSSMISRKGFDYLVPEEFKCFQN